MGSRYVQVTFQMNDKLSSPMESAAKRLGGMSNKIQAQYKDIGRLGREWTKVGKSLERTGAALTKKVTLPIVAAGTAAGKLYMDFDKSMAQINTLLDDDSHLKGYESAVMKTSDQLGINAKTAAEGLYQTISVLGDHGETTSKTFNIMAQASKAGGADVVDAVNMIATAMNGYGQVSDETAQRISDLSFKTVKLGKTTFPELANSMSPLFPLANSLGISYEELYATMSTATTSFAGNTAEASTQIKGLMTGFLKPSEAMANLIEKAGYSSGAAMIKAEGLAGALKIVQQEAGDDGMSKYFGNVRGLTAALGLSGKGMEKFEAHLQEMQNASGATSDALAKMGDTDMAKWNKALVKAQNAGIKFGKAVLPAVTPMVEKLGNAISKAADWFSNLSEGQQQMIVKSLGIAAAVGPVMSILGKGATTVGGLLGHVSKLGKAMDGGLKFGQALTKVFPVFGRLVGVGGKLFGVIGKIGAAIGPTGFIFLGIAAAAMGAALLIYKNWDKIKPVIQGVIDKVKSVGKWFGDLKAAAGDKLNAVKAKFGELKTKAGDMKNGIKNRISSIKESFGSMKSKVGELRNGVASRFDAMKEKVGSFKDRTGEAMQNAGAKIKAFMSSCQSSTTGVKGYLGGLINFVKGVFTGNWRAAWNGVVQAFSAAFGRVKSIATSALSSISSFVSSIASKVSGLISKISGAKSSASSLPSTVPGNALGTSYWKGGWTRINEKGGEILNLPRGTQIIPHDVSMEIARNAGASTGSRSITIAKIADTVTIREEADIDKLAQAIAEEIEKVEGDVVHDAA